MRCRTTGGLATIYPCKSMTKLPTSSPVDGLEAQIRLLDLPKPVREYAFYAPARQWAFDLAYPARRLAVEVEGGSWQNVRNGARAVSRHTSRAGFREDCIKYNVAALIGWTVLRFTVDQIRTGSAVAVIERAVRGEPAIAASLASADTIKPRPKTKRAPVRPTTDVRADWEARIAKGAKS